jgi:capsular polysaccharide biosynthesis protein
VELTGYLAILRRWWWTLLVAVWVAALLGYLLGTRIDPTYESSVRMLVGPINTDTNTLRASGQLVQTYAELATSTPLLTTTVRSLGLTPEAEAVQELAGNVRTTANDQTRILTIRVQGENAAATTLAANEIANSLIDLTSKGTSRPEGQVQVIEYATVPTDPIAPQISLIVLMSAAAGLLGAIVLILLAEYLADRIQDVHALERITGSRELAVVPTGVPAPLAAPGAKGAVVPVLAYAPVVAALSFDAQASPDRRLVVATGDRGMHGTDLALGLAAAVSAWRTVVVIDADPAGRATGAMGLAGVGVPGGPVVRRLVATAMDGVQLLPADAIPDIAEISPDAVRELLAAVGGPDTAVIVDAGDLVTTPSAMVWAGVIEDTVLAVRRGSTRRTDLREALARLGRVRAKVLGTIFVDSKASRSVGPRIDSATHAAGTSATSMARRQRPDEG